MKMKSNGTQEIRTAKAFWCGVALAVAGLWLAPSAQASYSLSFYGSNYTGNHQSGGSSYGDLICQFNYQGGRDGILSSSYDCSSSLNKIDYKGGDYAQATCLVIKDKWGRSYSWNICDWNGIDQIDCHFNSRYFQCSEIQIFGCCRQTCNPPPDCNPPPTCVPEPSTVFAGIMLLVPFGIQTARRFHHRRKLA
jgi:hypothetical protein